jgi:hypothetical protein
MRRTLNNDQIIEYDLLKKLSEELIVDNFKRNPTFYFLMKTSSGYTIYSKCSLKQKIICRWAININIDTNEAILSCNEECEHKNPNKKRGSNLILFKMIFYLHFILNLSY